MQMRSSREVIREYLKNAKQLVNESESVADAGGTYKPPTEKDSSYLENLILDNSRVNRYVLFFSLFLILVVFVLTIAALPRNGSIQPMLEVVGIGAGSEAGLLAWLLRAWSEYNRFSILLILCKRLEPGELMRVAVAWDLGFGRSKGLREPGRE